MASEWRRSMVVGGQMRIPIGHTLILDAVTRRQVSHLRISHGLVRVAYSTGSPELGVPQPITIGFLQAGDAIPLEMLGHACLYLEALQHTHLCDDHNPAGTDATFGLTDWTASLLAIQHLADSQTRLQALLRLLVEQLGQRCGAWYVLPMHLKQDCLAELVNHSRPTVCRHMSRWRQRGWIVVENSDAAPLKIAPALIEA